MKLKNILPLSLFRKWGFGESLGFHFPALSFSLFVFLILVLFMGLGEVFFRIDVVREKLTGPRIGSDHKQFQEQVARLEKLAERGETIDCIFLGNSMVWLSVNPLVVNQVFEARTGQQIHCFNFGVSGMPASSAGQVAEMLVNRYHPKILIYGTFTRDFTLPKTIEDAATISSTPWLRYVNGEPNIVGWLYEHSYLFRYKGHIADALTLNFRDVFPDYTNYGPYREYGLDAKIDSRIDVNQPPDFQNDINRDWRYWLNFFEIQPENINGLQQIIKLKSQDVNVIIIEMPIYDTGYLFFTNGEQDYLKYVDEINEVIRGNGISFWRISEQVVIPFEDWWDYFHVNFSGTQIFSEWLGEKLSEETIRRSNTADLSGE